MKYFYTACFIMLIITAKAQTGKGGFLVSGSTAYNSQKSSPNPDTNKSHGFSLSPKIGYFPISRLCVGIIAPMSWTNSETVFLTSTQSDEYHSTSRALGAGPFVRYYFPLKEKLFALGEVSYAWSSSHYHFKQNYFNGGQMITDEQNQTFNTKRYQLGAGLAYFPTPHVGIELLGYYERSDVRDLYYSNTFTIQLGLQIYLGK